MLLFVFLKLTLDLSDTSGILLDIFGQALFHLIMTFLERLEMLR